MSSFLAATSLSQCTAQMEGMSWVNVIGIEERKKKVKSHLLIGL